MNRIKILSRVCYRWTRREHAIFPHHLQKSLFACLDFLSLGKYLKSIHKYPFRRLTYVSFSFRTRWIDIFVSIYGMDACTSLIMYTSVNDSALLLLFYSYRASAMLTRMGTSERQTNDFFCFSPRILMKYVYVNEYPTRKRWIIHL